MRFHRKVRKEGRGDSLKKSGRAGHRASLIEGSNISRGDSRKKEVGWNGDCGAGEKGKCGGGVTKKKGR